MVLQTFQQRFQGAPSQWFVANSPLVIPDAHFPIVFSSLMFIFLKIGCLGKNGMYQSSFPDMVLKSLLSTTTLSEGLLMVDWLHSLDWQPLEIFAEKLPFSLCILSDSVAVLSKDFKTIAAKVGE